MPPLPPIPTLFPYTTLFRSRPAQQPHASQSAGHRRQGRIYRRRRNFRPCRRSEEHTSELQSPCNLVCRLLLEKKKKKTKNITTEINSRRHIVVALLNQH